MPPLSGATFRQIQEIVGQSFCTRTAEELTCYAYDATAQTYLPDAVAFPKNAHEVAAILKLADKQLFYVIPRGSGSGMTGGSLAVRGGVGVVLTRMNRILEIDKDNLIAHVEPGVVTALFHSAVEKEGLFYPPDPSSSDFSTLGARSAGTFRDVPAKP